MAGSVLLIVVSNPAHRLVFNRHLRGSPHHLVFAADAEDAFDRFAEAKPDLVLLHERIDGARLVRALRDEPRGPAVPIILIGEVLSDHAAATTARKSAGADGTLAIPFDRKTLLECITPAIAFGRMDMSEPEEDMSFPIGDPDSVDIDTVVGVQNPLVEGGAEITAQLADEDPPTIPGVNVEMVAEPQVVDDTEAISQETLSQAAEVQIVEPAAPAVENPFEEPKIIDTGREEQPPVDVLEEPKREPTGSGPEAAGGGHGKRRSLDESQLGRRLAKRIRSVHALMQDAAPHEVLGISEGASARDVNSAYVDLSLEFHPDRFLLLQSGELKRQIFEIFQHVVDAYLALAPPLDSTEDVVPRGAETVMRTPSATDELEAHDSGDVGSRTGEFVRRGRRALEAGETNRARLLLRIAALHESHEDVDELHELVLQAVGAEYVRNMAVPENNS